MASEVELIAGYEAECTRLTEAYAAAAVAAQQEGRARLAHEIIRLSKIGVVLRFLVDKCELNSAPRAVRILWARLCDTFDAFRTLVSDGFPAPAAIVLRAIFETTVHLAVVLVDPPVRAKLFEDFLLIERLSMDATGIGPEAVEANRVAAEAVRANYHPKYPNSWCWLVVPSASKQGGVARNPNLRELAESVHMESFYDGIYGRLSGAVHPAPSYESWLRQPEGHMALGPKYPESLPSICNLAATIVLRECVSVISYRNPGEANALRAFVASLLPPKGAAG